MHSSFSFSFFSLSSSPQPLLVDSAVGVWTCLTFRQTVYSCLLILIVVFQILCYRSCFTPNEKQTSLHLVICRPVSLSLLLKVGLKWKPASIQSTTTGLNRVSTTLHYLFLFFDNLFHLDVLPLHCAFKNVTPFPKPSDHPTKKNACFNVTSSVKK